MLYSTENGSETTLYLIRNTEDVVQVPEFLPRFLYWSVENGWVFMPKADIFIKKEIEGMELPENGYVTPWLEEATLMF
jgi:hypothetical protein